MSRSEVVGGCSEWAERWILDPAFTVSRPLPQTIEREIDPTFDRDCAPFPFPSGLSSKIPNARIRGEIGLVILPRGEFVGELVAMTHAGRHEMLRGEHAYLKPLPHRARTMKGNYYALLGFNWDHDYHWGHDLIMGARGIADRLPCDTRLIVPEKMKPFQIETLGLLGLDDHPRVPFPKGSLWKLENLYVVTPRLSSATPYRIRGIEMRTSMYRSTSSRRHFSQ